MQSEWTPKLATQCSLHFENSRKIKFIAYIYIHFNQNFDEKSDIRGKIEAGKHLHAVFLLTAELHKWRHGGADIQSDCREPWFILKWCDVAWLNVIIGM